MVFGLDRPPEGGDVCKVVIAEARRVEDYQRAPLPILQVRCEHRLAWVAAEVEEDGKDRGACVVRILQEFFERANPGRIVLKPDTDDEFCSPSQPMAGSVRTSRMLRMRVVRSSFCWNRERALLSSSIVGTHTQLHARQSVAERAQSIESAARQA